MLAPPTRTGLRENRRLFALLVLLNAFVGGMVGTERTLVPLLGRDVFLLASSTALLSFIGTFGVMKALANLAAGQWSESLGRRRVLLLGWLVGLPVPFLLMFAPPPHWWLVLVANALLGVNQGLCWSMTLVMKLDLAGERRRGLAVGLNEFSGYLAVGLAALVTGYLAARYGLRPIPFLVGVAAVVGGLALAATLPDTRALARAGSAAPDTLRKIASRRALLPLNQAGLVNNLNDGVAWGLFPLWFGAVVADPAAIGLLVALYPLTWGLGQLGTGALSDRVGRKPLIAAGLVLQAAALFAVAVTRGPLPWALAMVVLGLGTAMVYPTLLSAVADTVAPVERATALGIYRFWRDLGFAVGALAAGAYIDLSGAFASGDTGGIGGAILLTSLTTLASGVLVYLAFEGS